MFFLSKSLYVPFPACVKDKVQFCTAMDMRRRKINKYGTEPQFSD